MVVPLTAPIELLYTLADDAIVDLNFDEAQSKVPSCVASSENENINKSKKEKEKEKRESASGQGSFLEVARLRCQPVVMHAHDNNSITPTRKNRVACCSAHTQWQGSLWISYASWDPRWQLSPAVWPTLSGCLVPKILQKFSRFSVTSNLWTYA